MRLSHIQNEGTKASKRNSKPIKQQVHRLRRAAQPCRSSSQGYKNKLEDPDLSGIDLWLKDLSKFEIETHGFD
jgi:hypothetical protein